MSEAAVTSGKWSNVPVRIGTALAIAAVVLFFLWIGRWVWLLAVAAMAVRMGYEFARMIGASSERPAHENWIQLVVGPAALLLFAFGPQYVFPGSFLADPIFARTLLFTMIGLGISALFFLRGRPALEWATIGGAYIFVPLFAMLWLRNGGTGFDTPGARRVLFVILIVVAADAGAYFAGKTIGGPKFIPRLSPNKTWAGFAGGLVAGGLLGGVLAELWSDDFFEGVLVGLVLVVAAVAGDFLESGFKRHFGVKDTGGILPGHGGVLDRVDSHMAALTVAAVVIALAPGLSPV